MVRDVIARHRFLAAERGGEPKVGAAAGTALQPDSAAHQFDQLGRDREAKAGAAKVGHGGIVALHERVEDNALSGERNSDSGIANLKAKEEFIFAFADHADANCDRPLHGELHGVAYDVGEDLPETPGVAAQPRRYVVIDSAIECDS